ncbi:MAG TPA: acyl-CoA dehydrogenase family protein [Vicinamibacterales bacterium]|nr:acyl-CoA dehydrogenase family protein [Vicinamibacterales bacterium]
MTTQQDSAGTGSTTGSVRGGMWLLEDAPDRIFTPEQLTDEHRLMAQTTDEFVDAEVLPQLSRLENKDWELAKHLIHRCGELGLLGVDAPEEYGGLALDKVSSIVVAEHIARSASFAVTFGGQTNLMILPLTLFGSDAQKRKYLPRLVAGEIVGAYALSETGSGSDALAARTRATRQDDGSWVVSGEKMWISNGGFADLFIVFANVNGDQFTAFLVERGFPGFSNGKEEHKMGLHGSSTTPIVLQDVRVPAENVLGEVGRGHKVALNTLNFGRFKLGAMCVGGCRAAIGDSARYAAQRKQFNQPIAAFGAIKHKLGEMTARTYALESLVYRITGLTDAALSGGERRGGPSAAPDGGDGAAIARVFEEFAIEASIAKVLGSEVLDYVLDENVQIHGGNGFVSDYSAERYYRDARVNRIFEGTNEINRLLIPGMLIRRAVKGELPLIAAARRLQDEILSPSLPPPPDGDGVLGAELRAVAAFKKVALIVLGTAMQTFGDKLTDQQEILSFAADILIDTCAAESAVVRARMHQGASALHEAAAQVFVDGAAGRIEAAAKGALAAMAEGDTLRTLLAALRRVLKVQPINAVALRRQLADAVTAAPGYILS